MNELEIKHRIARAIAEQQDNKEGINANGLYKNSSRAKKVKSLNK